nr:2OG-Fe(II) oxygenase [Wenzhouxiangellaceae bacterium]
MHAAANRSETRARPERILAAADESGDELRRRFDSALPFRHLVLDSFFEPDFAERLIEAFPSFDERLAMNENGEVGAKCVHQRLPDLGPPWRELDDIVRSPDFLEWLGAVTGIPGLRYDPDYFGGGTHENRHGQELDPHVDFNRHPTTGLHRRLNLIVYLNREWDDAWGGAIDFHADPHLPP